MRTLLLFALLPGSLSAQYTVCNDYSLADPCSDPKKHHVATRTIYTVTSNDIPGREIDTAYETYDRNGNVTMQKFFKAEEIPRESYFITYSFLYNANGRIKQETNAGKNPVTYTYSKNGDTIEMRDSKHLTTLDITYAKTWYNKTRSDTNEIALNADGDTIYRMQASRCLKTSAFYQRKEDGTMQLLDSHRILRGRETIYIYHQVRNVWSETKSYATTEISSLDKKGRITTTQHMTGCSMLMSVELFEYNQKGQLTKNTRAIYPENYPLEDTVIVRQENKYLYDKKGKLVQMQSRSSAEPDLLHLNNNIYNSKGLLTEKSYVVLHNGSVVKEEHEYWMYTYY